MVTEEIGVQMAHAAFEPDVEKVREFGVHDVVVVGRVHANVVDGAALGLAQVGGRALPDLQALDR